MQEMDRLVGYLKGLLKNREPDEVTDTIAKLFEIIATRQTDIEEELDDLNDFVEGVDEAVTDLENDRNGHPFDMDFDPDALGFDEDDEDEEEQNGDIVQMRAVEDENEEDDEEDEDDEDDMLLDAGPDYVDIFCPHCYSAYRVSFFDDEGAKYTCPKCGKEFDMEDMAIEDLPLLRPNK